MRKLLLGTIAGLLIALTFSFKTIHEYNQTSAEVNKIKGVAIFTDCIPVKEYEMIGSVKIPNMTLKDHVYYVCRDQLILKAKEKYPGVQGLIIYSEDSGQAWYTADVIKFK